MLTKAYVAASVALLGLMGFMGVAGAQTVPATPAEEASDLFGASWPQVLDLVKTMAPIIIGAGLVLLAVRKVTGALKRGKAPSF
jgi:hypothetical protein